MNRAQYHALSGAKRRALRRAWQAQAMADHAPTERQARILELKRRATDTQFINERIGATFPSTEWGQARLAWQEVYGVPWSRSAIWDHLWVETINNPRRRGMLVDNIFDA